MEENENRLQACRLLAEMAQIAGRLPKKGDFDEKDTARIKSALGPWPRALEAAGLKEKKPVSKLESNRIRRKQKEKERRRRKKDEENS